MVGRTRTVRVGMRMMVVIVGIVRMFMCMHMIHLSRLMAARSRSSGGYRTAASMDPAAPVGEVVPTRLFRNDGVLRDRLTLVRVAIYIVGCPWGQTRRVAISPWVRAEGSTPRPYHQR
jgi:hypothetical protein